jgi:hypothetical protein
MLAPTSDPYGSAATFGVPAGFRREGFLGAAVLLVLAVALWTLWPAPLGVRWLAGIALSLGAAAFLARAFRQENVELDFRDRTCRIRRGIPPFIKREIVPLDGQLSILTTERVRANAASGHEESHLDAWVSVGAKRVPILHGWSLSGAPEHLSLIADRLGATLETVDDESSVRRPRISAGAVVMWVGVLSIFSIMFWPVISGKRPLRPVWAAVYPNSPPRSRAFELYREGYDLYQKRSYDEAERKFREAMSAGRDEADCYNMLAYVHAGRQQFDEALATAEKALSYAPESGTILDTVGEMHELRGEFERAVIYYQRALRKFDMSPPVETNAKLGRSLIALGQRSEAIPYLREASRYPGFPYGKTAIELLQQLGESVPYATPPPTRRIQGIRERS